MEAGKGYLYVVWAPGHGFSKVGFTKNLRSRLSGLASSSSAPFVWRPFAAFQLKSGIEARRLETMVKTSSNLAQNKTLGKDEHFECPPSLITETIRCLSEDNSIELISFPYCMEGVRIASDGYAGLPDEILEGMSEEFRMAYWMGVRHAFKALTYLDGAELRSQDLWELYQCVGTNETLNNPVLWHTVLTHYGNHSTERNKEIARNAIKEAAKDENQAYEDWQYQFS